ncbi:probable protein phosphatase 2C 30 [Setaria viridis]|uniref:probable protein phosphatase 2C 30 n=1 Tax=Setaria viridis TaxID=4556 RepID=UPI003B3A73A9
MHAGVRAVPGADARVPGGRARAGGGVLPGAPGARHGGRRDKRGRRQRRGAAWSEQAEEERAWRAAQERAFRRIDAQAALACACGRVIARPPCRCPRSPLTGYAGSTAVVAVLVAGRVVVANCGDSRAVLCRGPAGTPPVPLSDDHKCAIQNVIKQNVIMMNSSNVMRNSSQKLIFLVVKINVHVNTMRAINGDSMLRPKVITESKITITERTVDAQCLILRAMVYGM